MSSKQLPLRHKYLDAHALFMVITRVSEWHGPQWLNYSERRSVSQRARPIQVHPFPRSSIVRRVKGPLSIDIRLMLHTNTTGVSHPKGQQHNQPLSRSVVLLHETVKLHGIGAGKRRDLQQDKSSSFRNSVAYCVLLLRRSDKMVHTTMV